MSANERLLIVAKLIANDMMALASNQTGHELFMGMGLALGRVYSVLRGFTPASMSNVKPKDMIQWIQDQPMPESGKKLVTLQ